jgi:sugar lactone lactonase YvrE
MLGRSAAALALVAAAAVPAWLISGEAPLPARFAAEDCRRVGLVDAQSGRPIGGGEDLALTPDGAALIVSAHDRRDPARPNGGLYAVPVAELAAEPASATVAATPLLDPAARATPFRPHGISLSRDGRRLAVVNRIRRDDAVVEIGTLDAGGWHGQSVVRDARFCRANDLDFEDGGEGDALLVTIDRADCHNSLLDLAPGARTGSLVRIAGGRVTTVRDGLRFPNGIAAGTVAETRGRRLVRPDGRRLELPGAPDNLSTDGDGLIVAVHPNLLALWLYIRGWTDRAPSRLLRVGPDDTVEVLLDDPAGALYSGATVGVMAGGRLIAGSARDAGLLVCGAGGPGRGASA